MCLEGRLRQRVELRGKNKNEINCRNGIRRDWMRRTAAAAAAQTRKTPKACRHGTYATTVTARVTVVWARLASQRSWPGRRASESED